MTIRRILVHIDYDALPRERVDLAVAIAARFDAVVIGFAAGAFVPIVLTGGFVYNGCTIPEAQADTEIEPPRHCREDMHLV